MGNPTFSLGEVQPGEIQHIRYELRRCSVVIADAVGVVIDRFQVSNSIFYYHDRPSTRLEFCGGLRSLR